MTEWIGEFMDERDEWHYWWVGVAIGWTAGLGLGLLLGRRPRPGHD
jgi:ElaB/YqjD/DUF883 family membrane-anchored ribosome-binding protein